MQDTLTTLLEQAEAERNAALAAFNQTRARRDAAREQSRDLATYRGDYERRWQGEFRQRAAAPEVVRCWQQFDARLTQALAQQQHALSVCEAAFARAHDNLTAHELRVASVRKLIERRATQAQRAEDRREQKTNDETAARVVLAQRETRAAQDARRRMRNAQGAMP